ncbi:MAG: 7-cyano-7-deazaguanine synthase [Elusimicrobiota bacterium]|nr:7-cyano-7-deazaguanine synthase [Elusimicrobiota bacterium]
MHKADVARLAARLARRFPLELTFSCLRPRGVKPCGNCSKCAERRAGLR